MPVSDVLWEDATTRLLTVTLGLVTCLYLFLPKILEKRKYPPGPIPLPFIGNSYAEFASSKAQYKYGKTNSFILC